METSAQRTLREESYAKRRKWSRTDTARFLNDRSATCWALMRRRRGNWPREPGFFGRWLQVNEPKIFLRAHKLLASARTEQLREKLVPSDLL